MAKNRDNLEWWENPLRNCKDDDRFTDLTLITAPHRTEKIALLIRMCCACPVYYDCLSDLLAHPEWENYGIRAGMRGKS